METTDRNYSFHTRCLKYFEFLRRTGRNDDIFVDEFFYTIPTGTGQR